jgi:hypothetical protein
MGRATYKKTLDSASGLKVAAPERTDQTTLRNPSSRAATRGISVDFFSLRKLICLNLAGDLTCAEWLNESTVRRQF